MSNTQCQPSNDVINPFSGARADLGSRAAASDTAIIAAAIVLALYLAREVLVPIALAVLLSFVLAPVVVALARLRIGTVASVLLAVALAFAVLGGLGAVIGKQVAQLAENLPQYQVVIEKKLQAVRSSALSTGVVEKAADALHGLESNVGKAAAHPGTLLPEPQRRRPAIRASFRWRCMNPLRGPPRFCAAS